MNRSIILLAWACCILPFLAQAQKEVRLISSRDYVARKEWGVNRFYKPVFLHEGSTLSADSSDYNPDERFFDAYGNVVITQPNGTVVYADKLHYIKDERKAILTNNVRMVDAKGAILTTNHLTYNLNSKIGTYTNGGRIINERDTLNSKNGYYFENSQDAYFRYDVIVRTPQTNIFTDTLRYNSTTKMAYFYGPTNIKGKNGGNLYTENGDYHTETDRARFGKNNLYTEGSKFLRGDSLYYDGKLGYGRAIKNVVFIDTAQQGILYGQKGIYLKKDESMTMTDSAYMIMVTKNDSTKNKASADTTSLDSTSVLDNTVMQTHTDTLARPGSASSTDSVYMAADTLYSRVILLKDYHPIELNLRRDGGDLDEDEEMLNETATDSLGATAMNSTATDSLDTDSLQAMPDSLIKKTDIAEATDSLLTKIPPDTTQLHQPPDISADSLIRATAKDTTARKQLLKEPSRENIQQAIVKTAKLQGDTLLQNQRSWIGEELAADSLLMKSASVPIKGQADSSFVQAQKNAFNKSNQIPIDSSALDTAKTRIVKAYYHVRIFKSDLQARADSAYYGYPDSVIRCYGSPMIWAQGSQLSADTIYMQLKNQQLDNMLLKTHAFIVSTQLDSVKFNQVKGRKITGFFTNNNLDRMFVDGNAESIYYTSEKNKISGMNKSVSARIKILFEENEVSQVIYVRKTENVYTPVAAFDPDKEILPGFIWKPKDRPRSKEEIINPPAHEGSATDTVTVSASADSLQVDTLKSKKTTSNIKATKGTSTKTTVLPDDLPQKPVAIAPKNPADSLQKKKRPAITD